MPGMMDTILNIGLTPDNLEFWMGKLGDRVVMDSYRRLVQMYSSVVWGIPMEEFDNVLNLVKTKFGVSSDAELSVSQLQMVLNKYHTILTRLGRVFPQTIQDQLHGAIIAVFESWDNQRAKDYRKLYEIPEEWGTAVNVQSMVFGNMGDTSCTGVLFTRNPSTGENEFTGEFLVNAQGEDVVAGIRTPVSIRQLPKWNEGVSKNLFHCADVLEGHYTDMQDIEFTVQEGKLYLLQTRSGKRTARAAFKIVHDMVEEGLIEVGDVIKRLTREQLFSITQDSIDEENCIFEPNACGIAAGGGVVSGSMVLRSEDAINCKGKCILVRKETDPDDLMGMNSIF
jgi:pyruvate,orthophosphate dikinase